MDELDSLDLPGLFAFFPFSGVFVWFKKNP